MEDRLESVREQRTRGEMLKLIRKAHRAQQSRMDHVELWHILRVLGFDIGEDDVITFLQDLETLNLVEFLQQKDRRSNRVSISQIKVCARGLRVLEGKVHEESILL